MNDVSHFGVELIQVRKDASYGRDEIETRVRLLVDGHDFLLMAHDVELPLMIGEGWVNLSVTRSWPLASRYTLGQLKGKDAYDDGRSTLLECACDCDGCWPLRGKIALTEKQVIWCDFENAQRWCDRGRFKRWSYDGLGSFVFNRGQYESALGTLERRLKNHRTCADSRFIGWGRRSLKKRIVLSLLSGRHVGLECISFKRFLQTEGSPRHQDEFVTLYRSEVKSPADFARLLPVLYFRQGVGEPPDAPTYRSGLNVGDVLAGEGSWSNAEIAELQYWVDTNAAFRCWLETSFAATERAIEACPLWKSEWLRKENEWRSSQRG